MKKVSYGLSVLMVLTLGALVLTGMSPGLASPQETVALGNQHLVDQADASIAREFGDERCPGELVQVVIEIEGIRRGALRGLSTDEVVSTLWQHATTTQAPIIEWLKARGVEVLNTFWLDNHILVRIDPNLIPVLFNEFEEIETVSPSFKATICKPRLDMAPPAGLPGMGMPPPPRLELMEVHIRIESADLRGVSTDALISTLKQHATRTQSPIIEWLKARGVEVLNTFWLDNLILVTIDPNLIPLLFNEFEEIETVSPNFRTPRSCERRLELMVPPAPNIPPPGPDGLVEVNISIERADLRGLSPDAALATLQQHVTRTQAPIIAWLKARGVEVVNTFWLGNFILVRIDPNLIPVLLNEFEEIEDVSPNFKGTIPERPLEPMVPPELNGNGAPPPPPPPTWGVDRIRAPEVWGEGIDGAGVRIAVLDTGVHITHPDLEGRMYNAEPGNPEFPGGWIEFDAGGYIVVGSVPHDTEWHGTHVSGTALGGATGARAIGVAPGATLMHALVLPEGVVFVNQLVAGMEWARSPTDDEGNAAGQPADVVCMSVVFDWLPFPLIGAIDDLQEVGIVPVAAIGNDGVGTSSSPGNVFDAFGIGATHMDDTVPWWSGGEVVTWQASHPDPYIVPDFGAPGTWVLSAFPPNIWAIDHGTSMATPHVAGTVALMLQHRPNLTVDQIYRLLWVTACELGDPGQDIRFGWGIIDAFDATTFPEIPYITLVPGWNLISLPIVPPISCIEVVLAPIMDDVIRVWHFDAETDTWKSFGPGPLPDDLTDMLDGRGYWIYMDAAATLNVVGTEKPVPPAPPSEYPVFAGWNHIGFRSLHPLSAGYYLGAPIVDIWVRMWGFHDGVWYLVSPSCFLIPGRGYWLNVSEDGTIVPPNPE